jgi:ribonuclease P protein component
VVGRRVGSAVVRNQVKRRLRAIMANVIGRLNRGAGVVIRALPGAGTASFAALRTDVEGALGALGGYGR